MQALFKEIVAGDVDAVRERLGKAPGAVAIVATPPPKKHAGQSPLMVACKTGQFEIMQLLLDDGADVDFVDSASPHPYRCPVLHDAIKATVLRARRRRPVRPADGDVDRDWIVKDRDDAPYDVLRRMLESGADIHARDSYDNSALHRAVMDAQQMLPPNGPSESVEPELAEDLTRIFALLFVHGADPDRVEPTLGRSVSEHYGASLVGPLLNR